MTKQPTSNRFAGAAHPPLTNYLDGATQMSMASANPIWGAPRIHGELLKLGFEISERTVSRLMPKDRKSTQTWMTFLHNHVGQLVSIDFFTVATIRL
jgi:hypothetical protein